MPAANNFCFLFPFAQTQRHWEFFVADLISLANSHSFRSHTSSRSQSPENTFSADIKAQRENAVSPSEERERERNGNTTVILRKAFEVEINEIGYGNSNGMNWSSTQSASSRDNTRRQVTVYWRVIHDFDGGSITPAALTSSDPPRLAHCNFCFLHFWLLFLT